MRGPRLGVAMLALAIIFAAQPAGASAAVLNDSLANAVNAFHASAGLPTVVASPTLQAAAQFMAEDVATHGPPAIPHMSSDGRTAPQRMADAGYPVASAFVSEIVAWGAPTAADAMRLWLNSAPHSAVLNDGRYRAAGFGVACWGAYPCVWVVTFGTIVDATYGSATASFGAPPPPSYHTAFYAESAFPVLAAGQHASWVIAFTNTGATGWSDAHVGTAHPLDSASPLASATWLTFNRPARQTTPWVGPGEQAWFIVDITAPAQPGTYRLYLRPLIDGVAWMEDTGAYVDVTVR